MSDQGPEDQRSTARGMEKSTPKTNAKNRPSPGRRVVTANLPWV